MIITSKSANLEQELKKRLFSGKYSAPRQRFLTEKDICREYGVSRSLAREVLMGMVRDSLLYRRQGSGTFPTTAAASKGKGQKHNRDKAIALYLPWNNTMFLEFAREFMIQALPRKDIKYTALGTMDSLGGEVYDREIRWLCLHQERGYKRLARFPNQVNREEQIWREIEHMDFGPVVILNDFWLDGGPFHSLRADDAYGTKLALDHLIKLGHTRIMYVDATRETRENCMEVFQETLSHKSKEEPVIYLQLYHLLESSIEFLKEIEKKEITAIFVPYDESAVEIIEILRRKGKRVPEDISVVGFYDSPGVEAEGIALTTVKVPVKEIVKTALDIFSSPGKHKKPAKIAFKPELVVRNTTCPIK